MPHVTPIYWNLGLSRNEDAKGWFYYNVWMFGTLEHPTTSGRARPSHICKAVVTGLPTPWAVGIWTSFSIFNFENKVQLSHFLLLLSLFKGDIIWGTTLKHFKNKSCLLGNESQESGSLENDSPRAGRSHCHCPPHLRVITSLTSQFLSFLFPSSMVSSSHSFYFLCFLSFSFT